MSADQRDELRSSTSPESYLVSVNSRLREITKAIVTLNQRPAEDGSTFNDELRSHWEQLRDLTRQSLTGLIKELQGEPVRITLICGSQPIPTICFTIGSHRFLDLRSESPFEAVEHLELATVHEGVREVGPNGDDFSVTTLFGGQQQALEYDSVLATLASGGQLALTPAEVVD